MITRSLFITAILLSLAFLSVGLLSKALGSLQPPSTALAGFVEGCEGKPQPCWYGIVPGVTTVDEAQHLLSARDYQFEPRLGRSALEMVYQHRQINRCTISLIWIYSSSIVDVLSIQYCKDLQLGDILAILGTPESVLLPEHSSSSICLYFESKRIILTSASGWLLQNHVDGINLVDSNTSFCTYNSSDLLPWYEFVSPGRFGEIEPVTSAYPTPLPTLPANG